MPVGYGGIPFHTEVGLLAAWRILLAELVGTFFLVFAGAGAIVADRAAGGALGVTGIALAHGLALAVAVTATAAVSGGHLNPAVSVGLWAAGRLPAGRLPWYLGGQLAGAVLAGALLAATYPADAWRAVQLGTPALAPGVDPLRGAAIEAVLTALLLIAVYGTAVDPRAPRVGGFGIGLTVAFAILAAGPITGAALNPARAFGTAVVAGSWDAHWVYWLGPLAGGVIGALLYERALAPRD